jgi:hypothetical protein
MRIVSSKICSSVVAVLVIAGLAYVLKARTASAAEAVSPAEARAIAKEAYVYGFPMVDSYRIQYD